MLIHNRRKRNEWLEDQQAKSAVLLEEARIAASKGKADHDQILLLNRERAAQDAEAARKAKKSIFTRAKEALLGGAPQEEQQGGRIMSEVRALQSSVAAGSSNARTPARPAGFLDDVNLAGPPKATTLTSDQTPLPSAALQGGPLDRRAAADSATVANASRSWWNKMTGR